MARYEVRDGYASDEFEAPDDAAAVAYAKQWLADGDWPREETQYLTASVYLMPGNECVGEATLTLQPLPPPCIGGHDHDWCRPHSVVGGLRDNPGVHGSGGGVKIVEVCRHCGQRQHTDTWATHPATGEQGVERVWYTDPDEASLAWIEEQAAADEVASCDD